MENHGCSMAELLQRAEAYCAVAEHCASEVRKKIKDWGGTEDEAEAIEQKLYENKFLNDARYCNAYVHDKVAYQRWGRMKIQMGLRSKNLPETEISSALKNIDETGYFCNLKTLASQKKTATREQQIRFLLQRGFTYSEIQQVVKCEE